MVVEGVEDFADCRVGKGHVRQGGGRRVNAHTRTDKAGGRVSRCRRWPNRRAFPISNGWGDHNSHGMKLIQLRPDPELPPGNSSVGVAHVQKRLPG